MKCIYCNSEVNKVGDNSYMCPVCGYSFQGPTKSNEIQKVNSEINTEVIKSNSPDDIILRLITLRSVLGSICNDYNEKTKRDNAIKENEKSIANCKKAIETANKECENKISEFSNKMKTDFENKKKNNTYDTDSGKTKVVGAAFALGILTLIIINILCYINVITITLGGEEISLASMAENAGSFEKVLGYIFAGLVFLIYGALWGAGVVAIVFILGLIGVSIKKQSIIVSEKANNKRVEKMQEKYFNSNYSNDCESYKIERNRKIANENNNILKYNENIATIKNDLKQKNYKGVMQKKYDLSIKVFGDLIHFSDYANIDYILYLFVTKRADNMKDALAALDAKTRNNELVSTINQSTEYISKQMNSLIKNLGNRLEKALDEIRMAIGQMNYSVSSSISALQKSNEEYMDYYFGYDDTYTPTSWDKVKGFLGW